MHPGEMFEYLIATDDDEFLGLHLDRQEAVLRPCGWQSVEIDGPGDYRLRIDGMDIEMNWESPGLHVIFTGDLSRETADGIAAKIASQLADELHVTTHWTTLT